MARKKAAAAEADSSAITWKRVRAGLYESSDQRYSITGEGDRWYLTDTEQQNEFGQATLVGPFANLKEAREQAGRPITPHPLPAPSPRKADAPPTAPPRPKPQTWLDKLESSERRRARQLIGELEALGVPDADEVARGDITGLAPRAAQAAIEALIERDVVSEVPADERDAVRAAVLAALRLVAQPPGAGTTVVTWHLAEGSAGKERAIRFED